MGVLNFTRFKSRFLTGFFILLGLFFVFLGPAFSQDIPDDFEVLFTSQPAMVGEEIEIETLTLKANGETLLSPKVYYRGSFPDYIREELAAREMLLGPESVQDIYRAVLENDFFTLEAEYTDPRIMDGDLATLRVTANGQTHSVTTRNIKVRAFDNITTTINGHLPEDRRLLYNAINGADYEEVER